MKFTEEKLEKAVIMVNETVEMSSFPLNKLDILKI
jgi:hypothetical protein